MTPREQELRERFTRAGQGHVFQTWERLDAQGRARLLDQLERVELHEVEQQKRLLFSPPSGSHGTISPPELFQLARSPELEHRAGEARRAGERLLREGRVAFLLVAGGQASRLGFEGPKGAFRIGPVSGLSLFGLHARRLLAARERYGQPPRWYVMTSPANHEPTQEFFLRHRFFGLDRSEVLFFRQAMIPALDFEGRLLMSAPDSLFLAPNGHGGVLLALEESGALADARERRLEQFSYFQVDNPLARPADPLFIGLHALARAEMSSKAVSKRDAKEKVGVLARIDGGLGCIEYSDLPADLREAREPDGKLRFRAGNIAVHVLRRAFVEELTSGGSQLPWHLARKSMTVLDPRASDSAAITIQGAKFETFVFDALARSKESVTLEVERHLEFSPVKNATGEDSPGSARADLCRLHGDWIRAAGLPLPPPDSEGIPPVEIDPLLAEDCETFLARRPGKPRQLETGHLYTTERD